MKCNRLILLGWKSKNTKRVNAKVLLSTLDLEQLNPLIYKAWDVSHVEACKGEIEGRIELEYIPYYGGADPVIEVRFRCKRCKSEFAGTRGLPYDLDGVNKFLTERMKDL